MRIKICGLTEPEHIAAAVEAGADAIGLVMVPSVRQVSPERAAELLAHVPDTVERFAVFRLPDPDLVRRIADLPFTVLQGEAAYAGPIPRGWRFVPTFRDEPAVVSLVGQRAGGEHWTDGLVLVDGPGDAGAGVTGSWQRAQQMARQAPLMLAGGLSPDNVADAITAVRPAAVDVSSGVEAVRGRKSADLIFQFVQRARSAC